MEKQESKFTIEPFSLNLFSQVYDADKNIVVSPLSIAIALLLVQTGACKESKDEILKLFKLSGIKSKKEVDETINSFLTALDSNTGNLQKAVSVWCFENDFGVYVKKEFNERMKKYGSEIFSVSVKKDNVVGIANEWISKKTNGLINDFIKNGDFDLNTVLALINTLYFNEKWKKQFDEKLSGYREFTDSKNNSHKVKFMCKNESKELFFQNKIFKALKLEYSSSYSMELFLPVDKNTLQDVLGELHSFVDSMYSEEEVDIACPVFKFESQIDVIEPLIKLGVKAIFDKDLANFSDAFINSKGVRVDKFKSLTKIDCNEKGTEAAAVTLTTFCYESMRYNKTFTANRPFIFMIRDKATNSIVFIGSIVDVTAFQIEQSDQDEQIRQTKRRRIK